MESQIIARGAALLILPMAVASCGGSSDQGLIKNSPPVTDGCTELCDNVEPSGVVAKIEVNDDTGELSIRFVTITDNLDGTFTYRDGQREELLDAEWAGDEMVIALEDVGLSNSALTYGLAINPDEAFVGVTGWHTDADVIPVSGTATYDGGGLILTENSGEDEFATSRLEVNFLEGSADLFAYTSQLGDIVTFDEIRALNMQIDGYSFTGDEVVFLLNDQTVNITGTNSDSASAGMFFGPVNVEGNPLEFGAVAVAEGDSEQVVLVAAGEVRVEP